MCLLHNNNMDVQKKDTTLERRVSASAGMEGATCCIDRRGD